MIVPGRMKKATNIFSKKIVVGAMGLPINGNGKFLLTRRHAPGIPAFHKKWQVAGGALEFGETPEQTLVRELEEELGVSAQIIHPQPIVKTSIWYGHEMEKEHDTQIILIAYVVKIGNQKVDITRDDETNKYGWFTFEEVLTLDSLPMTIEIIQEAEKIIKTNKLLE